MMNFTAIGYFVLDVHEMKHIFYVKKNFNNYAKNIGTTVQIFVTWVTRLQDLCTLGDRYPFQTK